MCETENNNTPQAGKKPTSEDEFYLDWGKESLKNNFNLANEILKQLITLSTTLLGVSIIFEKIVSVEILRIVVLLLFFVSLVFSLLGILPYEKTVALNSATEIKKFKRKALNQKRIYIWVSGAGLTFGFAIILAQLIFKLLNK